MYYEDEVHEFHVRLQIDLHSYFHATFALLEDFEIFDDFDRIFAILSSLFRPI